MKCILTFIIISFFVISYSAQNNQITPSSFEWMAKTSINIMDTYKYYDTLIDNYEPKFLLDARSVQTFGNDYVIPTTLGNITVGPIQMDFALYWKWQLRDSLSFGFLAFVNSIDLQIDENIHPELCSSSGEYGDLYGWKSRKYIIAVHPEFNKDIDVTIGALIQQTPYVTIDSLGNQVFSIHYFDEPPIAEWRTYEEDTELFLNGTAYGYEVRTLYEFKESSINLFEINKELKNKRYGEFELGLNYYKHSKTVQTGFQYKNDKLISFLPFKFDLFWDIYKKDKWNELSYAQMDMTLFVFKDKYTDKPVYDKKDFYISLNWGSSYSKCIFDEALLGYSWKLSFENIFRTFSLAFGGSYNDYNYLFRVPIKNETMVLIDLKMMI
ncbi:MAG: hypothetical protein ISS80_03570 [Candidatus Cloacimonetes bacterium]|nr:hypothetical protein [Candidatus Cloacimonadota bacterium]